MGKDVVETWPAPVFIEEELAARNIPLDEFLSKVGIRDVRWKELLSGDKGMLLNECNRVSDFLRCDVQFIARLNLRYMLWKRNQVRQ